MSAGSLEVVVPFPVPRNQVPKAHAYRSTWILSSLGALKQAGHYEKYLAKLPPQHHEDIFSLVAGVWMPLSLAHVHYEACDRLDLPVSEQLALGRAVGDRAQGTMLSTGVRLAKAAGVTPWTVLPQYPRLWQRGVDGGALAVYKLGPKEARIDIVGCELFSIGYFRAAFRGVLHGMAALFCRTSFIHDVPTAAKDEATFRFQWA
jgi:hypothetical protein